MGYITIAKHPDYEISKLGMIKKKSNGKIKSQYLSDRGYYMVSIRYGAKNTPCRVHRLIAETFIPNPENKPYINHINGIKTDNRVENLEWCTQLENIHHAISAGLLNNKGSANYKSILKEADIPKIRELLQTKMSQRKIGLLFGVKRTTILKIKLGIAWKHTI